MHRVEMRIDASPERIFACLTEPERLKRWMSGLVESTPLGDATLRVGARSRQIVEENGRRIVFESEVTALEAGRRLEARLTSGDLDAESHFVLLPDGAATLVRHEVVPTYKGALRLLAPLAGGLVQRRLEDDMDRLKRLAESDT